MPFPEVVSRERWLEARLAALFGGSRQLIIHHVMFGPDWDAACPTCTNSVDDLSDGLLAPLRARGCSAASGPPRCPATAVSCAMATRSSTPI